jgi:hypothetical protein
LNADGQIVGELDAGDEITIRRSRHSVRLVRLATVHFWKPCAANCTGAELTSKQKMVRFLKDMVRLKDITPAFP